MRIRTISSVLLMALLAGRGLLASPREQSPAGGLRGPVIGYVLDATVEAIRPVNGIPGSSVLGAPVTLPFPIAAAAFSPRADFALATSGSDDKAAMVLRNIGTENNVQLIEGAISGADVLVFNAGGSAGVLLASIARQLQIVRGLPDSPTVGPVIDLSSIPGTVTAIAIDHEGSNVLIAVSAEHGSLYLAGGEETRPRFIVGFGSPSALALLNGDQDVIVADAAMNEVTLLRNYAGEIETVHLAGERDGISGPAGLQISQDGRKLYIAESAARTLDVWNFEGQSMEASYALDAEPTRLTALQRSSTFVLNEIGDHPLLLLDAVDVTHLGTYFVPAGKDRN
jgi:DNA-binding beta-propeller fold protein YncE